MTTQRLSRELLPDTSLWRLTLRISPRSLSALLIGPESAERSIIAHSESLADASLHALENAVYDNPLLTGDFASVSVIFAVPELMLCPPGLDSVEEQMAQTMLPDSERPRRLLGCDAADARLLYWVDAELLNFVSRTFAQARLTHSLGVTATFLQHYNRLRGDAAHLYALSQDGEELHIAAFTPHGTLRLANRYDAPTADSCAYFALAAAGGADATAPFTVGGAPELRNETMTRLRAAAPSARVLPLTLPPELLAIKRAAPEIPDDMIFLTVL